MSKELTPREKYAKETGDEIPANVVSYQGWHTRYITWLENNFDRKVNSDRAIDMSKTEFAKIIIAAGKVLHTEQSGIILNDLLNELK